MYSKNPTYFHNPETTMGVRRMGPTPVNTPRHMPMGMLSENGKIVPAPIPLAGLAGYGEANGEEPSMMMEYVKYAGMGLVGGAVLYAIYHFTMK